MSSPRRVLQKVSSRDDKTISGGADGSPSTSFSDLTGALANRFTVREKNQIHYTKTHNGCFLCNSFDPMEAELGL